MKSFVFLKTNLIRFIATIIIVTGVGTSCCSMKSVKRKGEAPIEYFITIYRGGGVSKGFKDSQLIKALNKKIYIDKKSLQKVRNETVATSPAERGVYAFADNLIVKIYSLKGELLQTRYGVWRPEMAMEKMARPDFNGHTH